MYIFYAIDVPSILHPHADTNVEPAIGIDSVICTATDDDTDVDVDPAIDDDVDVRYYFDIPRDWGTLWLQP